jgi:hypothetical protein
MTPERDAAKTAAFMTDGRTAMTAFTFWRAGGTLAAALALFCLIDATPPVRAETVLRMANGG